MNRITSVTDTPTFASFDLEQWQSEWEHEVDINLADSGVAPVRLGELLVAAGLNSLDRHELHYPEVNGTLALRQRIAELYPDSSPDQVLVTNGAAEANSLIAQTVLTGGDHAVVMTPGYQQVRGLATNLGAQVEDFPLSESRGWRPDLEALHQVTTAETRLISVNSPNNPTGMVLTDDELNTIVDVAGRHGSWLHSDEVYRGSELDGPEAPTAWGRGDRVLAVGSLSKAYGLSGLRIGWIIGPEDMIQALWRRHEYATISAASLSMALAEQALTEPLRRTLLDRQKRLAQQGRTRLLDWVAAHPDLLAVDPPASTALGFPRLLRTRDSVAAATAIREQASVLVAPGVYLGADAHLRISHALDPDRTVRAFERIAAVLGRL